MLALQSPPAACTVGRGNANTVLYCIVLCRCIWGGGRCMFASACIKRYKHTLESVVLLTQWKAVISMEVHCAVAKCKCSFVTCKCQSSFNIGIVTFYSVVRIALFGRCYRVVMCGIIFCARVYRSHVLCGVFMIWCLRSTLTEDS